MRQRIDSARRAVHDVFTDQTCTAPEGRSDRMRDIVVRHVPRDRSIRLLDIGCGTGSLVFRLAEALPEAIVVGIDISAANIRAAKSRQPRASAARVRFDAVDYLDFVAEPFDVLVADGVLHLIPGDTAALVQKLAQDVAPGGGVVSDMAYDCAWNRGFALLRRALRLVRTTWLDAQILRVGRLLHGHEMDEAGLRERVSYMYIPPVRMMNHRLQRCAERAGLHIVREYAVERTSLSELKHRVTVFARERATGR